MVRFLILMHDNSLPSSPSFGQLDELARIFNTAMVATRAQENRDFSAELFLLMESPAFRAILNAVRQHARLHGISEKVAAEQVIKTFRKLDDLWSSYTFQEGVEKIGTSGS